MAALGGGIFQGEVSTVRSSMTTPRIFRRLCVMVVLICLSACASNLEVGNSHFANGQYDQAAMMWNPLALDGDPSAQYNVGLLWEYGLGSTPLNREEAFGWYLRSAQQGLVDGMVKVAEYQLSIGEIDAAVSWLNLAARWGNQAAVNNLAAMSRPVPQPDLLAAQQYAQQQQNAALAAGVLSILGAAAAGYYGVETTPINTYQPPVTNNPVITVLDNSCVSDYSCGVGYRCVKQPFSNQGTCMQAVDQYGLPTYNLPDPNSLTIPTQGQCEFSTDCPIGFRCDTTLKVCVQ